jgi:ferritin-like metal-binding protein YciE
MQTGHELLIHGLKDILDGERQLVEALEENAADSQAPELKKAFEQHRKQTEGQVERLEECFELLGEEPEDTECHGIRGIIQEKKAFSEEDPSDDLVDVFNIGGAIKVESYEICEYESLIDLARAMKHNKVAQLLNQTLKQERETLRKLEALSKKIKPNEMMKEEQRRRLPQAARSRRAA